MFLELNDDLGSVPIQVADHTNHTSCFQLHQVQVRFADASVHHSRYVKVRMVKLEPNFRVLNSVLSDHFERAEVFEIRGVKRLSAKTSSGAGKNGRLMHGDAPYGLRDCAA